MTTAQSKVTSINEDAANTERRDKEKAKPGPKPGPRPTKYLPTERITFTKQLDILRAWAAASGPAGKIVTNNDVAGIVGMQPSTVSLANAFFSSIGLLTKAEGGYIPAPEVISFSRAYEWSPETAVTKLAPVISKTWFAEELLRRLAFAPMTGEDATAKLADACSAAPEYRDQIEVLLDYLANAGLIEWDGTQVRKGVAAMASSVEPAPAPKSTDPAQSDTKATPAPTLFGTTEGVVNFSVNVKVNMGEFKNWEPQRIAAFFGGIAQVLAAKAQVEKGE